MKLLLLGIYQSLGSWRLRFSESSAPDQHQGIKADFEITITKAGLSPEASAFYDSLQPGESFLLTRVVAPP